MPNIKNPLWYFSVAPSFVPCSSCTISNVMHSTRQGSLKLSKVRVEMKEWEEEEEEKEEYMGGWMFGHAMVTNSGFLSFVNDRTFHIFTITEIHSLSSLPCLGWAVSVVYVDTYLTLSGTEHFLSVEFCSWLQKSMELKVTNYAHTHTISSE